MASMSVSLRSIPDTQAAIGWAGSHCVIIDRPEGQAGGMGLGFNGGQMLALAIGGCFCNDLRYEAESQGIAIDLITVDVSIELVGTPALVSAARLSVHLEGTGDLGDLVRRAAANSTVANSVQRGFPIDVVPV